MLQKDKNVLCNILIFSVAERAIRDMKRLKVSQSISLFGESGSGKTESTKLMLKHLSHTLDGADHIRLKILNALPVLEAFGNAETFRNSNSSRFGKFIQVFS